MAKIFRIASKDDIAIGMFSEKSKQYRNIVAMSNPKKNPLPSKDKIMGDIWLSLQNPDRFYFGCSSMKQLLNWINVNKITSTNCNNLSLYVVDISDEYIIEGETQSAFWMGEMNYTEKYPLMKIHDFIKM